MWHPLAGSIFAVSIVASTVAGTAFVRADDASSKDSAWVVRKFDFSVPALNFESKVPHDSRVETVPMEPTEPGTIGKVKVIGKIAPGKGDLKVETTMVGYNLQAPATALRICSFDVEALGYTIRIFRTAPDLTEAKLLAKKAANGKPQSAALGYCFARTQQTLGIYFIVDVSGAASEEAADDLVRRADEYAASFIDNLSWENGQQSSFGEDLQTVPLLIGDKEIRLSIPNGWDIPINEFRGALPAELHMVRRKNGKDVGLVWLFVQDMKEKPDLDTSGAAIVKDYFVKQTPDVRAPVLLASGEDSTLAEQGIASRTFRFSAENKQGSDAGDIEATVVWHNGRLSVLTLWSAWTSADNRNTFFSRLLGLTVYDIVRQEVLVPQP
ncbi:hypothetical protein J2855_002782 [Agrobacterium tumefaciens]|uniref:hypothetical protein n=1 Tax=Agrobacterium tumefaciens TaxID=358 RepID=UPI000DCF7259|nr:hypothetical protein [Agrobacterium tumefaciens]MBP2509136.1 hypothetical protein [Agrobacterium tumefaciens]MBP2518289.1 hypothetical protein [Agrobacterium tumefaciens]MBP2576922.1 hypothetical protein [Agrobacterium tumefaciens]MBP2594897.1 hypothetical protein [Agrobacterium tumefaciens]